MKLRRRQVDSELSQHGDVLVDVDPFRMHFDELQSQLNGLSDRQIIWLGDLFTLEPDTVPAWVQDMLRQFDHAIALCPEC
jgi:hypothetical protein